MEIKMPQSDMFTNETTLWTYLSDFDRLVKSTCAKTNMESDKNANL